MDASTSPTGPLSEKDPISQVEEGGVVDAGSSQDGHLRRDLKARQITMIAIGGAIGTGLIIGTGAALANAGPGSILISYSIVGLVVWLLMCAIGEMASWLPLEGGFTAFADRYCDHALGFGLGYTYWFKYIIVTPNQLTAAALVIQYWCPPEKVNPGVFITIFLLTIVVINYFGVRIFGEFEFYLSSFKVIVVVALIVLSAVLMFGGGPDHDVKGFRYYRNPGAFKEYLIGGSGGKFLGFWSSMVTAVFAYLGTELVGVTVGEAENPRRNIPRAIRLTFYRIVFFYVLSIFLLGCIVPYNSPDLLFASGSTTSTASASPFVVAIKLAGIRVLPSIINACILLFVFSASNSDLYIASRTIYSLAREGKAPRILARTDSRGVPIYALGLCTIFCCLAYMNVSSDSKVVFGYFVNLVTIFGLLAWVSIFVAHLYFRRALKAQSVDPKELAFKSPMGIYGSWFGLVFCIIVCFTKNFKVFIGGFDYKNFITGYLGIPLYLILILGYKIIMKTKVVKPDTADLWTGRVEYNRDADEWDRIEKDKREANKRNWPKRVMGWFF